jgi:multidrug efflux pump subunit AcrA (membrane-fusion protein)
VSLLIGDDYPEAVDPQDWEQPASAADLRRRPGTGGKRHDWSRWRGHRPRSMLIQDAPDLAEDGADDRYGADDLYGVNDRYDADDPYGGDDGYGPDGGYGPDDDQRDGHAPHGYLREGYLADRITEGRYPESGYADFLDSGPPTLSYRDVGYAEPGHHDPGYAEAGYSGSADPDIGYPDSGYTEAGYPDSGFLSSGYSGPEDSGHAPPGASDRRATDHRASDPWAGDPWAGDPWAWPEAEGDGFRVPPTPEDYPWDHGEAGDPALEDEPSGRRAPLLEALFLRRGPRYRDPEGSRKFVGSAQRLGGILLAGASVVGVALYVPSILAADSRSFTGVVSSSGIASLNFGTSGRVGSVRVHLGQVVRKGELLATETGPASTAAVRADRAAITADKANLAALQADGSAPASITAAQAQLEKDRALRAADRMKLVATEIVAPRSGTVVAIYGQPGETVSRTGLSSSAVHAQASPGQQPRFSLLPSGPMASLRATGLALPVIALRTGGGWQVSLLIPQTDTSAVKVGEDVTISVPAARISGVKGTIRDLSPMPVSSSGGATYEAVVRVLGRTQTTPLSGMTANVQLGSLRLQGQTAGTKRSG